MSDINSPFNACMFREGCRAMRERIAQLEARLEIDHCWIVVDGKFVRQELPEAERLHYPDGIACRDATIRLLEDRIAELQRPKRIFGVEP